METAMEVLGMGSDYGRGRQGILASFGMTRFLHNYRDVFVTGNSYADGDVGGIE